MPPPTPPRVEHRPSDAELIEFEQNILAFVMNSMCLLIVEADRATRSLGEEAVKGKQRMDTVSGVDVKRQAKTERCSPLLTFVFFCGETNNVEPNLSKNIDPAGTFLGASYSSIIDVAHAFFHAWSKTK